MSDQTTLTPTGVLGLLHDAFNAGDMDRVAGFTELGAVDLGAGDGTVPGSAEHLAAWDRRRQAFRRSISDFAVKVERSIERGDTVGQLLLARGVMDGKPLQATGIHIVRVKAGKVVQHWAVFEGSSDRVVSPGPTEVLRRATEMFLAGFPDGDPTFVAPGAVDHTLAEGSGERWSDRRRALRARMSGISVDVQRSVESGDTVGQLIVTGGTLDGRPFRSAGFHLVRVADGNIVEHWAVAEPLA